MGKGDEGLYLQSDFCSANAGRGPLGATQGITREVPRVYLGLRLEETFQGRPSEAQGTFAGNRLKAL